MQKFKREEPLVTASGVSLHFGHKTIIRDIGTNAHPFVINNITRPDMTQGQTIAVVGPSGSGKSTLFKVLTGIYSPSTGTVEIPQEGTPGTYRNVVSGDVGFVQQTYPLSRNESVKKMLFDAANLGNIPKSEQKGVVQNYLESWGLLNQQYLFKKQLSGGQRQRVAIIEQLLCSHHFIVFDEPFSGLDVSNIEDVKKSFKKITTSNEINTIIFSTHDIRLAVELSDVVYVMGYEKGADGKNMPGGTIIKSFDLMEMGIAWEEYGDAHREINNQIQTLIKAQ